MTRPRVAITEGDPAGIGPEVAARAAADPGIREICEPIVYPTSTDAHAAGVLSAAAGRAAYDAIVRAVDDAKRGQVDAIATAPISKEALRLAGLPWAGHTDLLAHLTGAPRVAMMFHADALRVVLATIHVPLAQVPRLLTRQTTRGRSSSSRRRSCRGSEFRVRASASRVSTRTPANMVSSATKRSRCWRRRLPRAAPEASTSPVRFPPTRCSCGRIAASSTSWSPAITTRG